MRVGGESSGRSVPDESRGDEVPTGHRIARWAARLPADVPLLVLDALLVLGAYVALLVLRFDGSVAPSFWRRFWLFAPVAVGMHLAANWAWQLYGQIWRHASVQEARRILLAGGSATGVLIVLNFTRGPRWLPVSVVVLGGTVATALMGAVRFQSRLFALHRRGDRGRGLRLAVLGAGDAGAALIRDILRNPGAGLHPVAVFDDDPRKWGRALLGVPIVGGIDELPDRAERLNIHQALLATPTAGAVVSRAADAAAAADIPLKVMAALGDVVRGRVSIRDVRDLRVEDLLGREQVKTDLQSVRRLLSGRCVLVTGAGGSIGAEVARQVASCDPRQLVLLDRDDTHLHDAAVNLSFPTTPVLADIKDAATVAQVFDRCRPEVVFHAAAHKHVPILEAHACEAVATNVFGTINVIEAAVRSGVRHLVFISTDKAVRPVGVMGAAKWLGEQVLFARTPPGSPYCAVRFGNVLGSRGSVIPTFTRQIAAGGPVTVTDPEMTRFFMSIEEAVQLMLQAAALAEGNEVFMLEMGKAVNILELGKRMIRLSGQQVGSDIAIRITGVRSGEKLVEELYAPEEVPEPTAHPAIVRLRSPALRGSTLDAGLEALAAATSRGNNDQARALLLELASGPAPAAQTNGQAHRSTAADEVGAWSQSTT